MKIRFNNGIDEYDISFSLPLAVTGSAGTGKTSYLKKIIPVLSSVGNKVEGRRIFIMNPCHWGVYNSLADAVVPVKLWLNDSKYRIPSDSRITLLDFDEVSESPERIAEVIERIKNLSEQERSILIVDTIGASNEQTYRSLVQKILDAQSDKLFCVLTVQDANALGLPQNDVQIVLSSLD